MPTITDATVTLNGLQDLIDFAVANNEQFSGTYELLNYCNSQIAQNPYRFSSLTTEEQWSTAISDILRDNGFTVNYNGNGQWNSTVFSNVESVSTVNPINSNNNTTTRGTVRNFFGSKNTLSQDGNSITRSFTRYPKSGGLGDKAQYLLGSITSAMGAVSSGIWLGKTFDSLLYNANPDFWDSIGASSLNPEMWSSLTNGNDSPFAGLLNFVLGIDPENGTAQAYIDENTLGYMAKLLYDNGFFSTGAATYDPSSTTIDESYTIPNPLYKNTIDCNIYNSSKNRYESGIIGTFNHPDYGDVDVFWSSNYPVTNASISMFPPGNSQALNNYYAVVGEDVQNVSNNTTLTIRFVRSGTDFLLASHNFGINRAIYLTYDNKSACFSSASLTVSYMNYWVLSGTCPFAMNTYTGTFSPSAVAWADVFGDFSSSGTIDGVGNQPNAILPDTSTWDDVPSTISSLQQQYPDIFNNAMVWDDDYGTTTGNTKTYIPVPFPYATNYNQPVSFNPENDQQQQTQTSTQIDPQTDPKTLTDILAKIIQQTQTETQPQPDIPTPNPTDTGTGTTDPPIPPTGVGSALWSVYNPTQAQINSFGGWLWSGDIITQIQQILQNPMEGIIALHKVFAQPVVSGTGDIVVGRLSSGVSSNLVTNQYSYVDCGTVDLLEQFGNVFDYDPHTRVSLYLPFIGIVPLNTSDVMRGSINVKYGVDVFTGACLAMVTVTRDGNTVNMYQYSGVASVSYPLTGAQNSGLIGGLLSIAGGVASIATGNVVGGVLGAAGGVGAAAKSHMQRASSFSGNSGAMGIKIPYLIIERPQTKVASTFTSLQGYPTNTSIRLGDCSGQVRVRAVHVEGLGYATENEQKEIENLLYSGVLI